MVSKSTRQKRRNNMRIFKRLVIEEFGELDKESLKDLFMRYQLFASTSERGYNR